MFFVMIPHTTDHFTKRGSGDALAANGSSSSFCFMTAATTRRISSDSSTSAVSIIKTRLPTIESQQRRRPSSTALTMMRVIPLLLLLPFITVVSCFSSYSTVKRHSFLRHTPCKTVLYQSSNSGDSSSDGSGGDSSTSLNWDYDLWKEIKRRNSNMDASTSSNSLETLQTANARGTNLSLQQKLKLWYLTLQVKLKRRQTTLEDGTTMTISPSSTKSLFQNWTLQKVLIGMNILMYIYQINTSYLWNRGANLFEVINQPMTSPLTMDFMYVGRLASEQPHRFVTSGFLHGSLLHLICNVQSWSAGVPEWLESAGGTLRYWTIFLMSVIGGNICHTIFTPNRAGWFTPTVGASGGICGLLGYTYMLCRDMNTITSKQYSKHLARYMFQLILIGALTPRVSNAAHIGGFICGAIGGYFLGPQFTKSYVAKRWGNTDYLKVKPIKGMTPQLQRLMGPQLIMEQHKSRIPLYAIGIAIALFVVLDPNPAVQQIPWNIYIGLRYPGRLSRFL